MRMTDDDEDLENIRRSLAFTFLPQEAFDVLQRSHAPQAYLIDFYGPQLDEIMVKQRLGELVDLLAGRLLSDPSVFQVLDERVRYYTKDLSSPMSSPNAEKYYENLFRERFQQYPMQCFLFGRVVAFVVGWALDDLLGATVYSQAVIYSNAWFEIFAQTGLVLPLEQ